MSRTRKKKGAVRGKTTNRIINIFTGTWLSDDFISTVYDSDHCI